MDGDGTPAAPVVHDGAIDGFGQAAWAAPRQGCKDKGRRGSWSEHFSIL